MLGLGTLMSPRTALDIVRATLEETIKQDMPKFQLIYTHKNQDLGFRLYNFKDTETGMHHEQKRVKWKEGRQFVDAAKELIQEKGLEAGDVIDFAVLSYPEMILVTYYVAKDGSKQSKRTQL